MNYVVYALKDGTIVAAATGRRPYHRRGESKPFVDEDGCYGWHTADGSHPAKLTDPQRVILMLSITQALNTKKLLREQVEKRLERLEARMDKILALLKAASTAKHR